MPLVFVYGTLKSDQCNAYVMQGARCLGPARTVQAWRLVALAHYPALVQEAGAMPVTGELWEVPPAMMAALDRFEEVPELYTREQIEVLQESAAPVLAQVYFMRRELAAAGRELATGCWPEPA